MTTTHSAIEVSKSIRSNLCGELSTLLHPHKLTMNAFACFRPPRWETCINGSGDARSLRGADSMSARDCLVGVPHTVYPSKASTARSIRIPPPQRPALECLLVSAQTSEGVPERIWTRTLQKKVARHVQMPRRAQSGVAGNQLPTFSLENSSFEWTRRKAEGAGLSQQGERRRKGTKLVTHWRGLGPMMAYNFCQVQHAKPLGQGSGALVNPCKGKDFSDVLTIAIPPIDVWH